MDRRLVAPGLALALTLAPLACGSDEEVAAAPPRGEQAAARLVEARREVDALRAKLAASAQAKDEAEKRKQAAADAAEAASEVHDRARNALRDAEQKLASLEPPPPSDTEVFRRVQKQLLDAPALAKVAIQAEVSERKVTLRGSVPDDATRDAAVAVASGVDGVAAVESAMQVTD